MLYAERRASNVYILCVLPYWKRLFDFRSLSWLCGWIIIIYLYSHSIVVNKTIWINTNMVVVVIAFSPVSIIIYMCTYYVPLYSTSVMRLITLYVIIMFFHAIRTRSLCGVGTTAGSLKLVQTITIWSFVYIRV